MKTFDEKHIKNIALVGSAKSGKTTLAETMLFEAGLINRRGTVEDHNTISDFHEIEHQRGYSTYATALHTEWRDYKINIIDTPGLDDFIGEVISAVRVSDTVVMILNAQHGVEVGSELIWNYVDKYKKPTIFAINQLDHEYARFNNTFEQAKQHFGNQVTLMQYPVNAGTGFNGIIDLLKMKMYKFSPEGGKPEKLEIPEEEKERANKLHNELVEKAAENDEKLMELYFEKGNLNEDEMAEGIKKGMMNHDLFPVFCLSAKNNMGSGRMMGFIDNVAPSAIDMPPEHTVDGKDVPFDPASPPALFIFKTLIEPHLGRLSFFKVLSGEVKIGMEMTNPETRVTERIGQLFIMDGKNRNPVDRLKAGDIGSTLKLKNTHVNHTLNGKGSNLKISLIEYPSPRMRTAVVAVNKSDDEKLGEVLAEIHEEDPTLIIDYSRETKQVLLLAQGELHLQVTKWRIENVYNMPIEFMTPKIQYRETITRSAKATYKHKKQSGGAGQFGEVYIKIEPIHDGQEPKPEFTLRGKEIHELPWGGKLIFYNCITGGVIDARYIPSILKGVMDRMNEGPLTGSYVRDVAITVYDGKMHPVDSNDISFQIAGRMAFKEAFHEAEPQLLEPIYDIEVEMPEEIMGDVMSELQARRSMIMGMDARNNHQVISAKTPLAELDQLVLNLRSITQGRAMLTSKFADYAPVTPELQKKLTQSYHSETAEPVH
jgi:elongation factor G